MEPPCSNLHRALAKILKQSLQMCDRMIWPKNTLGNIQAFCQEYQDIVDVVLEQSVAIARQSRQVEAFLSYH